MQINKTLVFQSGDVYKTNIIYNCDGLINNRQYEVDLSIQTNVVNGCTGMTITQSQDFLVNYPILNIKNKPLITQDNNTSGLTINWAGLYTNEGVLINNYSFINNFIKYGNTALSMNSGCTLTYNSTIPSNFTLCFTVQLQRGYDGLIFTTTDNEYQIGYSNSNQKFYTTINNIITYSEVIFITDNPFIIYVVSDHIIIRQYNIYNSVANICNFMVKDYYNYPIAFLTQENN
ncbi:hypothetical protein [Clostridium sp.]|uniref:hypothetical protein n=1 Tax=Clostridium sp. TaxID=1506 RepID=UPI00262786D9|nr:hypothetical protein [Clostridium sp.]